MVKLDGQEIQKSERFRYLVSIFYKDGEIEKLSIIGYEQGG